MKIIVFDVREDEKVYLMRLEKELKVDLFLTKKSLSEETVSMCKGYMGVSILGQSTIDETILSKLYDEKIYFLSTRTIGFNHIDLESASNYGIKVCNASYAPNGVAEFTIMLILLTLRNYKPAMWRQHVNDYSLGGLMGRELKDLTIGVIGTGKIGSTVIDILQGFQSKILAYDPYENEKVKSCAEYVDLETIYREADIITVHMPLTEKTKYMINKDTIQRMKEGVILINAARGELMELEALIEGIETKKIGALGLDVLENEQGIYHQNRKSDIITNRDMAYIRQFPNVVLTQHMAFYTDAATESMVTTGVGGLINLLHHGKSETSLN